MFTTTQNEYIKPNLKPRDFQIDAVDFLTNRDRSICALPTGTGKTIVSFITYAYRKQQNPNLKLLYVTEKPLILQTITQDLPTYFNFTFTHIHNNNKEQRRRIYTEWMCYRDILIINYASLRQDFQLLGELLQAHPIEFMVIYDEATAFKNQDAQITKCIKILNKATHYAIAMTATPASRGLYDIYSIMTTLGIAPYNSIVTFNKLHAVFSSQKLFYFRSGNHKAMGIGRPHENGESQVCYMSLKKKFKLDGKVQIMNKPTQGNFKILSDQNGSFAWAVYNQVTAKTTLLLLHNGKKMAVQASVFNDTKHTGYKNLKLFRERSQGTMFVRAKREIVQELPPITVSLRYCDDDKYSQEAVKFLYNQEKYSASQIEIAQATPQAFLEHVPHDYKTDKIQRIIDFIQNDLADEKVIIYFPYTSTTNILKQILEKELDQEVAYCHGQNPDNNAELRKFLDTKEIQVLIGTNTILKGLNIQAVNHIVTVQPTYTSEAYQQLCGRINRIGGDYNPKFVTHFICQDTRDQDIYTALMAQVQHIHKIDPRLVEEGLVPQDNKLKGMNEREARAYLERQLEQRKTTYI